MLAHVLPLIDRMPYCQAVIPLTRSYVYVFRFRCPLTRFTAVAKLTTGFLNAIALI